MDLRSLDVLLGRRRLFVLGGSFIGLSALVAACGEEAENESGIARVGNAPTTTALPNPVVTDVVLLRTASSIEHSAISVYDFVLDTPGLADDRIRTLLERFRDDHRGHAGTIEDLTESAGGEPWRCGNPRLDEVVIPPIVRAILGGVNDDTGETVAPSDDPQRDVKNFAHAFETFAGATYQALVESLSEPDLRRSAITIATDEVRHAALLAMEITGRPQGYVSPASIQAATGETVATTSTTEVTAETTPGSTPGTQDIAGPTTVEGDDAAPPPTPIPAVYAIPGQFGSTAATLLVVGAPNDSGNRVSASLETPSLNTYVYEDMTPQCEA